MTYISVTGDVALRQFEEQDIPNKIKWINDVENNKYLHYDIPLQMEKTLDWFQKKDNTKRLDCVIEYKGQPIGLIGLLEIDKKNRKAEFYISMGEVKFKGHGIATSACRSILSYAFDSLELHKVYLNTDAENLAAQGLFEKVGFALEGYFRDDFLHHGNFIDRIRYGIVYEENEYDKHSDFKCRNPK